MLCKLPAYTKSSLALGYTLDLLNGERPSSFPWICQPFRRARGCVQTLSTTTDEWTAPVTTVMVTEDQVWTDGLVMGHHLYFTVRPGSCHSAHGGPVSL